MQIIQAKPTKSGNGFTEGKIYTFVEDPQSIILNGKRALFMTDNDNGHRRYVSRTSFDDKSRSAHLWDGRDANWLKAGYWERV